MTTLTDMLGVALSAATAIFASLDSVHPFDDYVFSLLDVFLAFCFLVITLEFVFYIFEIDMNLWDYVFADSDEED